MSNTSKSLQLHGLGSFEPLGIKALTGEACAFSQRVLCDVNEDGRNLLTDYWGVPTLALPASWNSQVNEQPAVGSVMLTRDSWNGLAAFWAFRANALAYVVRADNSMVALFTPELVEAYFAHGADVVRNPAYKSTAPRVGSRNVHQMTERVV